MKRILVLAIVGLLLAALGGCSLLSSRDVEYQLDVNGALATLNITYMNENGDLVTVTNWSGGSWSQSFSVSASNDEPFLAFVQAETVVPVPGSYPLEAWIRVDGTQKDYNASTGTSPQVAAFYLVD